MKIIPMKKHSRFLFCIGVLLAVLAGVTTASAQRNRNGNGNNGFRNNGSGNAGFGNIGSENDVPGPTAYAQFSGFIAQRNIFNPNRVPRGSQPVPVPIYNNRTRTNPSGPAFTLVGTMSYEKGMFAFFDGNQSELRKVLYQSDSNSIAGFTLAEITPAGVTLQTADKKQTVPLKIGDTMRQEGSSWQLAGQGGSFSGTGAVDSSAPAAADNSSPDASAAPSPALEGNDVLKKLMQQREQELK